MYAVPSQDSSLDCHAYRTIMASSGIHFTEKTPLEIGLTNVDGIMCVPKRDLLLNRARAYFEKELKSILKLGHNVQHVHEHGDGGASIDGEHFDFVVDATWGHYSHPSRPASYEPTLRFYYEGPPDFPAITLVDGPFCSVYPTESPGLFTLSSVLHTTLGRFATAAEARVVRGYSDTTTINAKCALMEGQISRYLPPPPFLFTSWFRYARPQLAIKTKHVGTYDDRSCQVSRRGCILELARSRIAVVAA